MYICTHTCMHKHARTHTHAHTHTHTNTHTYIHTRMCMCTHINVVSTTILSLACYYEMFTIIAKVGLKFSYL